MSEIGEDFAALRESGREKKRSNLARSTQLLRDRGIKFESSNGGVHLVIRNAGRVFDFWPSTGTWRERDNQLAPGSLAVHRASVRSGRGVFDLLKEMA